MEQTNDPILIINPKFNLIAYAINKYGLTLIAIIFLMIVVMNANLDTNVLPYFLAFLILFIIYVFIRSFLVGRKYRLMKYLFYIDKLIVLDDTTRGTDIVIKYNEIFDVLLLQDYIQKIINEGEILIKLSDNKFFGKNVKLLGIINFKETVKKISSIIYNK